MLRRVGVYYLHSEWTNTVAYAGLPFTSFSSYFSFPILVCFFCPRLYTLVIAIFCILAQAYLVRKGFTLVWLLRRTRGRLYGNRIASRPIWVIRRFSWISGPK